MASIASLLRNDSKGVLAGVLVAAWLAPSSVAGQQSLTLERAVALGLARGPTVLMAQADSAASVAGLSRARAFPNPTATAQYTKSVPRHHFEVEQPVPLPWTRSARVSAEAWRRDATSFRLVLERATVTHDVQVAYVLAAAAERRRELSTRTAVDALELVDLVQERVEAGDAAELEVALARVAAGEAVSQAASDSLESVTSLLELQRLIGEPVDRVTVQLADSLTAPISGPDAAVPPYAGPSLPGSDTAGPRTADSDAAGDGVSPLVVAAAEAELRSAESSLVLARRSRLPEPSLVAGFESDDPSGGEPGTLPVVGVVLSIPLFDRGGAAVRQARADLDRARAALDLAERESAAAINGARLRRDATRAQAARSLATLDDAERVESLSNRAYEEGAFPLTTVLEARRTARDAHLRYVEDLADTRVAEADYELAIRARRDR